MAVNLNEWNQIGSLKDLRKDFIDTPKGKQFRSLKVSEVVSVAQVRRAFTGLDELAESLKEVGQQSPIVVRPKNNDGLYVILQGERRWRAAQLAGFDRIDAIVVEDDVETNERILGQLTENIQRDDMRPLEISAAIKELLDAGLKATEVATKLGRKPSYVALYRDLLELPEMIRLLAVQDKIKDATTLQILKKIYLARPDIAENLISSNLDNDGGITRSAARSLLSRCQQPEESQKVVERATPKKTTPSSSPFDTFAQTPVQEDPKEDQGDEVDGYGEKVDSETQIETPRTAPASNIRHKLIDEDEEVRPEDFELPEAEETLPEGARRLQTSQVNIKLSMIDEEANEVLYGILVPDVVTDDPNEICVFSSGRYMLWPVSQVHVETVNEIKDESLAGW